ncbi:hypothetical protein ACJVC5_04420 [Peredibacter sp. HCB2-198]|uniref:hypothetical protein n=1 Tax=Peredibacter sp. HCB2-198 TaxID=3383025 RepID=UPI0038B45940
MKFLITIFSLLLFSVAQAQEVPGCGGGYAAGIGHVMNGQSLPFANDSFIPVGGSAKDQFFRAKVVSVNGKAQVELYNNRTRKKEKLAVTPMNEQFSIFSTENLVGSGEFPEGVPGAFAGKVFLIFICAN